MKDESVKKLAVERAQLLEQKRKAVTSFCSQFEDMEVVSGPIGLLVAEGKLPFLLDHDDPRVKEVIAKCKRVNGKG